MHIVDVSVEHQHVRVAMYQPPVNHGEPTWSLGISIRGAEGIP